MPPESPDNAPIPDSLEERFIQEVITLARQGKIDEVRALLQPRLPSSQDQYEYEVSDEHPALIIEGPAAEVWIPKAEIFAFKKLLPLTDGSPNWQFELYRLIGKFRKSIAANKHFVGPGGKCMPLKDMPLNDAMEELKKIFFMEGQGRLRVRPYPTVRLD